MYEVLIERGKIREFARATQSTNPAYHGEAPVIPATFLTTARLFWEPREVSPVAALGFESRRILHGEEEYVFHGPPPHAGQVLHATTRLDDEWEKNGRRGGRMKFARIVNEFRNDTGELVAEQRTTLIETGGPPKER